MNKLFEPTELNGLQLENRFVRAATWEGLAGEDGGCTPRLVELYTRLAEGGVGLIITGHSYVLLEGKHAEGQLGIYKDALIPGLKSLTRTVHEGGGKIVIQLSYGGSYLSKSRVERMTPTDIQEVAQAFGQAAARAREAGFDGVEIFAAHGFFLSQLLCPRYNPRTDAYGGPLENRARALLETVEAVRKKEGRGFPLLVKLNARDGVERGLTLEDSLQVSAWLKEREIDALEISGGLLNIANLLDKKIDSEEQEVYFRDEAKAFKKSVDLPLIIVGGIRSLAVAQKIVEDQVADYVSMCRPFIREPDLVKRWRAGVRRKADCISCNNCVEQLKKGLGVSCVPVESEPVETFFTENIETISAGPPHPPGTTYQIATGLEQWESGFYPVLKIRMVRDDKVILSGPSIPLNTDDPANLIQVIKALLEKHRQR
jgi:2,4-dienoyl-CoA reductase-like NADH-dependent reductase (Old Yellow Enzyme family)